MKAKGEFTFGSLPVLREKDDEGKVTFQIAQGSAIAYYVASLFDLTPKEKKDDSISLSILLSCEDVRISAYKFFFCKDEEEKKKLFEATQTYVKTWLTNIEKLIGEKGFFFEDRVTVADLVVFDVLHNIVSKTGVDLPEKVSALKKTLSEDKNISSWINRDAKQMF
jgi:glutathione S-transferase